MITDFSSAERDVILVSKQGFGNGLISGQLLASQFTLGASATSADHRFIFDTSRSLLSFDPDGNDSLSQQALLQLSNVVELSASDISVY